ncbi:MAG: transcriptional regulator [Butyrivibrio sp.]|nr:transcriptional regulator [Butyrivibrio sp.]
MDYKKMAEELLNINAGLLRVSANRMMDRFVRGELFVLNYLIQHDGTAFPKDLSNAMEVSTARIAALLNQIEKKGWIIRSTDGEDNRQTIITLTEAGKSEVEDTRRDIVQEVVKMLKGIGAEDANELLRIERKIMKI